MSSDNLTLIPTQILWAAIGGLVVVVPSIKFKFLTVSGAVAAFLLAIIVFGLGGWAWAVPLLTFFILSSLLSKVGAGRKLIFKDTFEKTGVRDHIQVAANGGFGALFVLAALFLREDQMYVLYLISLAVATADTWATEIGVLFSSRPRLITTFKRVDAGVSGAISLLGTLASWAGSTLIALTGYFFNVNLKQIIIVSTLGLIGSLIDSFLGATVQARYQCKTCNKFTEKAEHCRKPTILIGGWRFLNNDLVNLSAAAAAIFIYILYLIF